MSHVITGLFSSPAVAAAAVDALEAEGVPRHQMSVLASDSLDQASFGVETHSKLSEGAAIGAGVGGAAAALAAGFTMIGAAATGGAGLIVAGPLAAALMGAGAGAAGGGAIGGLIGLAIPEHEVKHYEDAISEGSVMVGVEYENDSVRDTAKAVFKQHDASKISHA